MHVKALRTFSSTTIGEITAGEVFEAPDGVAARMIAAGYLEPYATKVVNQRPTFGAEQSPALPAAPALPETTAKPSESGGRRRKTAKSS